MDTIDNVNISASEPVVFFTGAGISADDCGLPTYRGTNGIYSTNVATPLHRDNAQPERVHTVWNHVDSILRAGRGPGSAHIAIAQFAASAAPVTVVTQNIDGYHERAFRDCGVDAPVWALHGSAHTAACLRPECGTLFTPATRRNSEGAPLCPSCQAVSRPRVVLFDERLNPEVLAGAQQAMQRAWTVVVVGTSCEVFPAAHLVYQAVDAGAKVVWVNPLPAPASLVDACRGNQLVQLHGSADTVVPEILHRHLNDAVDR